MKVTIVAKYKRLMLMAMVLVCIPAVIICLADLAQAGNQQKECWKKINGEIPPYKGYPAAFDGQGTIEVVRGRGFIIDDIFRPVSSSTSYHAPGSVWGSKSLFSKGDYVAFLLDGKGRVKSLWLICKQK